MIDCFFCRIIRSLPISVPALSLKRLFGKRMAEIRSARLNNSCRIVLFLVAVR